MSETFFSATLLVGNPEGLHARPADLLARTAMAYSASIELVRDSRRVDAKSVLHLLTLGASQGTMLLVEARGEDAQQAVEALVELAERDFAERETETLSHEQAG